MALIKCIECNNNVSEFADFCPHCGCPTSMSINIKQNKKIDDIKYSIRLSKCETNQVRTIKRIREITGLGLKEAKKIVDELSFIKVNCSIEEANKIKNIIESEGASIQIVPYEQSHANKLYGEQNIDINTPKCPKCGSTAVFAGADTYSGTSYSTINRCANCGHQWKPGRKKRSWF